MTHTALQNGHKLKEPPDILFLALHTANTKERVNPFIRIFILQSHFKLPRRASTSPLTELSHFGDALTNIRNRQDRIGSFALPRREYKRERGRVIFIEGLFFSRVLVFSSIQQVHGAKNVFRRLASERFAASNSRLPQTAVRTVLLALPPICPFFPPALLSCQQVIHSSYPFDRAPFACYLLIYCFHVSAFVSSQFSSPNSTATPPPAAKSAVLFINYLLSSVQAGAPECNGNC